MARSLDRWGVAIGSGSKIALRDVLFAVYVLLCLFAQTWPGYAWFGNSIEPYFFGLPWSLVWVVGWVLATFLVLVVYHTARERSEGAR